MNTGTGNVVIYRSEAERVIDQWVWHGGGWAVIGGVLLAGVLYVVARDWLRGSKGGKA